ncbi:MAG TPA: ABC transporter substrate-binding protein [Burkholderiales bacterium]
MKKFVLAAALAAAFGARADVTVGVVVSATGPGAAIGVPTRSGFDVLPETLGGQKARFILLDDATDPTAAVRNARKLITEEKVDVLMGSTVAPSSTAIAEVAAELKVPQITLSPVAAAAMKNPWVYTVPQPTKTMMAAVMKHMKANGVKRVGYLGFNDGWGDLVYNAIVELAKESGMEVVTNERYARNDTSVTAQVLRVIAARPDAVVLGGSAVPAVLPHVTLRERGYKGPIYHNHGVINPDFIRVGGKGVEGAYAPTGPVVVAEQLPGNNPIRKPALEFIKLYEAKFGAQSRNAFAAYTWDAYTILDRAVARALKDAKPGTQAFREALRTALEQTKDVVGAHAVYNMSPTDHSGVDERSAVLVRVENGGWKFVQ